jgi:hypothetical protein
MDVFEARDVLRGYMAPANHAINIFAQTGRVHNGEADSMDGLIVEIDREIALATREHDELCKGFDYRPGTADYGVGSSNERVAELSAMIVELSNVRVFLIESCGAVDKDA